MEDKTFGVIADILEDIDIHTTSSILASWALEKHVPEKSIEHILEFCKCLQQQENETKINTLLRMSKLPKKYPKTFDNFDCRDLSQKQKNELSALKALPFIECGRNVIFIGPTGTGKTHLAQAIGNECCHRGLKAYFIKMGELKDKMEEALRLGKTGTLLSGLTKYSCLIIDEVGYCHFNEDETLLFFQIIDRIDAKGFGSIVITSNKDPSTWNSLFSEDDALECTLDRLTDNALLVKLEGSSYRGKAKECTTWQFNSPIKLI